MILLEFRAKAWREEMGLFEMERTMYGSRFYDTPDRLDHMLWRIGKFEERLIRVFEVDPDSITWSIHIWPTGIEQAVPLRALWEFL